ncbi:hypothetical protein [Flavobacterium sp. UBA6135]|uniref:hypothetical protein n=1 Tax=Flavobacterium sp. UBA6135 TaxID=1946553 RepID=UPI0025C71718|nr:hypothetical protein [Flavobacterium sp. UBA6135]
MQILAKTIIISFGLLFIFSGFVMLIKPTLFRRWIALAGSTNAINYTEITLRMVPAAAMIYLAATSKYPIAFQVIGSFMIATSLVLYCIPRQKHHELSRNFAKTLKPIYLRLLAPLAFTLGILLIDALF